MLKLVEASDDQTHPCLEVEAQMGSVTQGRNVHSTHIVGEDLEIHLFRKPRGSFLPCVGSADACLFSFPCRVLCNHCSAAVETTAFRNNVQEKIRILQ